MNDYDQKPYLDQELSQSTPNSERHLYHLPRECWTRKSTGLSVPMDQITGLMLHKISGMYAFRDDPFNPWLIDSKILIPYRLSYGLMIYRDGEAVLRVPEGMQAFHAGRSMFEGQKYCNRFMIGIGMVSKGKDEPGVPILETAQIDTLVDVCAHFARLHDFPVSRITTHEHTRHMWNNNHPEKPGDSRQGDPGKIPWREIRTRVEAKI